MGWFNFFNRKKQDRKIKNSEINNDIETQRKGYIELSELCLASSKRTEFVDFISNLKDYTGDEEYMTTLNYVIDNLYQKSYSLIICLDWKQEISSLSYGIDKTLKENFNIKIDLPQQENYEERASVSFKNVFKDFDKAIKHAKLQMSFIDTNSDQYVIVVHKINDLAAVKMAIKNIGYDCLNSNSRKISG